MLVYYTDACASKNNTSKFFTLLVTCFSETNFSHLLKDVSIRHDEIERCRFRCIMTRYRIFIKYKTSQNRYLLETDENLRK